MRRTAARIRTVLFAAGVAAALGFGVSQATAEPRPCPLTSIGSCANQMTCERRCERLGLPVAQGCVNGCCFCLLATTN